MVKTRFIPALTYIGLAKMTDNPYEPPRLLERHGDKADSASVYRRVARALVLAIVGFVLFMGFTLIVSLVDPAERRLSARWPWGLVSSIAFCTSELFVIKNCSYTQEVIRRVVVSGSITAASLIVGMAACRYIATSGYDEPQPLHLLAFGLPVFVLLAYTTRYVLAHESHRSP